MRYRSTSDVEVLAANHWAYVAGVLANHGLTVDEIDVYGYHYQTAFVHGYKHAIQDVSQLATLVEHPTDLLAGSLHQAQANDDQ